MSSDSEARAKLDHLALHFTSGAAWRSGDLPIFVRGDGCYVWDDTGRRVLDGLAGLFVVHIGHGRRDIVAAGSEQMLQLAYTPSWGQTHPAALDAAELITSLAPGDLEAVFFVSSGSEAVESAIKFSRQYHASQGEPQRYRVISRNLAYHGTTMGALSATGLDPIRDPFKPLLPGFHRVPNTLGFADGAAAAKPVEDAIIAAGADEVAMVIAEPVQNGGGAIVPPDGYWAELRRICDEYGVLLVADEVINGFGRVGPWFGSELVGAEPDLLTFAKGVTSGYSPMGGMLIRRQLLDALVDSPNGQFTHGATWGGHPVSCAVSVANLNAMQDEDVIGNVAKYEGHFRERVDALLDTHDVVRDVRGAGYFYAIELARSRKAGVELSEDESSTLVRQVLPMLIDDADLLIRADDRGKAKLMLSPPLIADQVVIDELVAGVDQILERMAQWLR